VQVCAEKSQRGRRRRRIMKRRRKSFKLTLFPGRMRQEEWMRE